ncbi:MAG: leucine--tRNA ligase [Candidatus Glassbacteria bacterium]|nr:leucine--tRNA ligase [Candidatus Glassbacteria bacterium]
MEKYEFKEIERKWRNVWENEGLHRADFHGEGRKCYCLVMFIYPSADRLHIGHWYNYGPTDTWARFRRMHGDNVFEPIGYDAFGLPAENYAIKHGVHPWDSTGENVRVVREQLKEIGAMYDWERELNTSEPEYYKWTQWIFLQCYRAGLAYRASGQVNWCPSCQTVLANEQVMSDGTCERCESLVTRKEMVQWFLKITEYADRLLKGLDKLDWPEKTKAMQRNWIERSEGGEIKFSFADDTPGAGSLSEQERSFNVFTTRPDTLFGVTYMVMAPEHPLVGRITTPEQQADVERYAEKASHLNEIQRTSTVNEKTGVFTGAYAINPVNGERVPVWIADYVMLSYGTGIIMAVPAHDNRDFEFARQFGLPIREVIAPESGGGGGELSEAYTEPGVMVNSGEFDGQESREGARRVVEKLQAKNLAEFKVNFRIRDWLISRQRYWGVPIPVVYCDKCGEVPVPEDQLPVELPYEVDFKGAARGVSPLATNEEFVNTACPGCGGPARREIDTMDTFVDSSWYFLRYLSPGAEHKPFDRELCDSWLPVHHYVGGAEHATMHLIYARFINMALHDLGHLGFEEPFARLSHQGIITNQGAKMSKSRDNVINPKSYIDKFGADAFRCYLMFMGDYSQGGDWDDTGMQGMFRFLMRVWRLVQHNAQRVDGVKRRVTDSSTIDSLGGTEKKIARVMHNSIKCAGEDLERMHFNTAISRIMELVNELVPYAGEESGNEDVDKEFMAEALDVLVKIFAPFVPHFCEELWREALGKERSVFLSSWPEYDSRVLVSEVVTVVIQINGKLRSQIEVERDQAEQEVTRTARDDPKAAGYIDGKTIRKVIYVPNKLVNFVVG